MRNFYKSFTPSTFKVSGLPAQLRSHCHCRTPELLATKPGKPPKLVDLLRILGPKHLISLVIVAVIVLVVHIIGRWKSPEALQEARFFNTEAFIQQTLPFKLISVALPKR